MVVLAQCGCEIINLVCLKWLCFELCSSWSRDVQHCCSCGHRLNSVKVVSPRTKILNHIMAVQLKANVCLFLTGKFGNNFRLQEFNTVVMKLLQSVLVLYFLSGKKQTLETLVSSVALQCVFIAICKYRNVIVLLSRFSDVCNAFFFLALHSTTLISSP